MDNPFRQGEERGLRPAGVAVVIFGATGDLTTRKLIPALYELAVDDYLPLRFAVVGAARSSLSDDEFRSRLRESVAAASRRRFDASVWDRFARTLCYETVDGTQEADFQRLAARLMSLEGGQQEPMNHVFYLATAPHNFPGIVANLKRSGLVDSAARRRRTAVVIEKPFGHDYESARSLNAVLRENLREEQILRIDHYLGKEIVQNILALRFANGIFEPLWNSKHISSIQISVCEAEGVGRRASYFDHAGILRDVVQNHLLQMLALIASEPPRSLQDPNSIRDEKVKVLQALRPLHPLSLQRQVVRAQYAAGYINGKPVAGYVDENGVPPSSATETYVAMRLEIDNWRWWGVPIFVRAGKRLPKRITEIAVCFKKAPPFLFGESQTRGSVLSIRVQPEEGISLRMGAKPPGMRMRVREVEMDFAFAPWFGKSSPEAYERLLLDAMNGDATLFARDDEIEEAWKFLQPVLDAWQSSSAPALCRYPAGSWGPAEAETVVAEGGAAWRML